MPPVRIQFALCFLICTTLSSCTTPAVAESTETPSGTENAEPDVAAAVEFLKSLYDPEVGLIAMSDEGSMVVSGSEYPFSRIFWVYSDNFLAAKALEPYEPELSRRLEEKLKEYDLPPPGYWEALFCFTIPEPPRVAKVDILQMTPEYVILSEDHNEGPPLVGTYADVLIYRAINLRDPSLFLRARSMWDGLGVWDDATEADGLYASYKLALLLIGANVLQVDLRDRGQIEATLWSMQQENGGITTFYDLEGNTVGTASTESTSLAILSAAPPWHCDA